MMSHLTAVSAPVLLEMCCSGQTEVEGGREAGIGVRTTCWRYAARAHKGGIRGKCRQQGAGRQAGGRQHVVLSSLLCRQGKGHCTHTLATPDNWPHRSKCSR